MARGEHERGRRGIESKGVVEEARARTQPQTNPNQHDASREEDGHHLEEVDLRSARLEEGIEALERDLGFAFMSHALRARNMKGGDTCHGKKRERKRARKDKNRGCTCTCSSHSSTPSPGRGQRHVSTAEQGYLANASTAYVGRARRITNANATDQYVSTTNRTASAWKGTCVLGVGPEEAVCVLTQRDLPQVARVSSGHPIARA